MGTEVVTSQAFINGVFMVIGMLLTGMGFLIKWGLTERKANKQKKEEKETEAEKLAKDTQEMVIKFLKQITDTLSQLNANQEVLKKASFLSLESTDLQLRELHEKGILNGESKVQRKKIAEFYKNCAKDTVFTELNIKSDYSDATRTSKAKKIS